MTEHKKKKKTLNWQRNCKFRTLPHPQPPTKKKKRKEEKKPINLILIKAKQKGFLPNKDKTYESKIVALLENAKPEPSTTAITFWYSRNYQNTLSSKWRTYSNTYAYIAGEKKDKKKKKKRKREDFKVFKTSVKPIFLNPNHEEIKLHQSLP